jgi:hypothetical protein
MEQANFEVFELSPDIRSSEVVEGKKCLKWVPRKYFKLCLVSLLLILLIFAGSLFPETIEISMTRRRTSGTKSEQSIFCRYHSSKDIAACST